MTLNDKAITEILEILEAKQFGCPEETQYFYVACIQQCDEQQPTVWCAIGCVLAPIALCVFAGIFTYFLVQ
jgi:hypothetical protein